MDRDPVQGKGSRERWVMVAKDLVQRFRQHFRSTVWLCEHGTRSGIAANPVNEADCTTMKPDGTTLLSGCELHADISGDTVYVVRPTTPLPDRSCRDSRAHTCPA